jgi:hypothetical protein
MRRAELAQNAGWLRTFLADVPIEWIPTGEPFSSFR